MSHEALGGPPTGDGRSEWTVVGPIPGGGEGDSCQPARRPNSRRIADPRGPREEHCAPCRPPEERGAGSREARNMAGRPAAPASPPADRDGAAPNVVARISQWADDHLRLVRTSKFTSSSDIPVEFIRRNVKLRGRLRRITENGLEIEHIPITLPIIASWRKEPCGVLLVKLAGVELTETGKAWLQKELKPSQLLWFQLLGKENSTLFCYLLVNRGRYFSVSLNEEILRRGLGKTVLVKGLNHDSKIYWKIHRNLLKAELTALKKGEGIWKEESEKESYLEKVKDSWREAWKKDSYFKKAGSNFNLKKSYDKFRSTYEAWKDNYLILKFKELMSRIHFRRKG
ncbi:protein C3orf33 homolog isoform X2 [Rhinolophus sinicus]|uniref:protein C3orf33 homolog isoform X2 n=1 Tax=Rhinolophus sinicus TaxID=89399 RepID=UPI003D7A03C5